MLLNLTFLENYRNNLKGSSLAIPQAGSRLVATWGACALRRAKGRSWPHARYAFLPTKVGVAMIGSSQASAGPAKDDDIQAEVQYFRRRNFQKN